MTIFLKKFGTTLIGRQDGRESYSAFLPTLKKVKKNEIVEIDFFGVATFTPSWGDEFLSPLLNKFKNRLVLKNTENLSVQATLKLLERIHNKKFKLTEEVKE